MSDASKFTKNARLYKKKFQIILKFFIFCYFMIIENETFDYFNIRKERGDGKIENYIRDIILLKYLQNVNYKNQCNVGNFRFLGEVGAENYKGVIQGSIDIVVFGITNLTDENEYFAFECKRLDGSSQKNGYYVNQGIQRYVEGKYAKDMPLAGMIGFVESGNVVSIVDDINLKLSNHSKIDTTKKLTPYSIENKFNDSYKSQHKRSYSLRVIDITHLMFDFKKIVINI